MPNAPTVCTAEGGSTPSASLCSMFHLPQHGRIAHGVEGIRVLREGIVHAIDRAGAAHRHEHARRRAREPARVCEPRLGPSSCASTATLNEPLIQTCDPPTSASPDQPQTDAGDSEGIHDVPVLRWIQRGKAVHRELRPREDAGDAVAARRSRDGDLHRPVDVRLERDLAVRLLLVVPRQRRRTGVHRRLGGHRRGQRGHRADRLALEVEEHDRRGLRRGRGAHVAGSVRRGASWRTAVRLSETTSVPFSSVPSSRTHAPGSIQTPPGARTGVWRRPRRASAAARTIRRGRRRARPRTARFAGRAQGPCRGSRSRRAEAPAARAMLPRRRAGIGPGRSASSLQHFGGRSRVRHPQCEVWHPGRPRAPKLRAR